MLNQDKRAASKSRGKGANRRMLALFLVMDHQLAYLADPQIGKHSWPMKNSFFLHHSLTVQELLPSLSSVFNIALQSFLFID